MSMNKLRNNWIDVEVAAIDRQIIALRSGLREYVGANLTMNAVNRNLKGKISGRIPFTGKYKHSLLPCISWRVSVCKCKLDLNGFVYLDPSSINIRRTLLIWTSATLRPGNQILKIEDDGFHGWLSLGKAAKDRFIQLA